LQKRGFEKGLTRGIGETICVFLGVVLNLNYEVSRAAALWI